MVIENKFNIDQNVFVVHNNVVKKAKVLQIKVTVYELDKEGADYTIKYLLEVDPFLPKIDDPIEKKFYEWEVFGSLEDLTKNLVDNYKKRGN